jgi:hypothetical protein
MEGATGGTKMKQKTDVNDILNEFLADFEASGQEALDRYVKAYPDLMETLHERAGIARMFSLLPEPELTREEEEKLKLNASSVVQDLMFKLKHQGPAGESPEATQMEGESLAGLLDRANEIGESFDSGAAKLRLSPLILKLLDRRKVRPGSLPRFLLERLANFLKTEFEAVFGYVSLEPARSGGFYKSDSAPVSQSQSEFADLVKYDPDLDEADKEYWLSFPAIEEE